MRVAIVEDHRLFCDVLCKICSEEGYEVVCAVNSGNEAVRRIILSRPDVVILDLMLPDIDGFDVAEQIRKRRCAARILGISSRCDGYTVHRVQKACFQGFVDERDSIINDFRLALSTLAAGRTWFSESFSRARQRLRADPVGFAKVLSNRQQTVLAMIGDQIGDVEIAFRLGVKPETCGKSRYRIRRKLGLPSREALFQYARSHGFWSFAVGFEPNKSNGR